MVLSLHMFDDWSSTHWSCSIFERRDLPNCLTRLEGKPTTILSKNETNFAGAARELKDCINAWNQSDSEKSLGQKDTKWKFNPPGAPHFRGIWDRLIRSCIKAMTAVLDGRSLTDDVLIKTMCSVEQTLNARPLTSVGDDLMTWRLWHKSHPIGKSQFSHTFPTGRPTAHRLDTNIERVGWLFR